MIKRYNEEETILQDYKPGGGRRAAEGKERNQRKSLEWGESAKESGPERGTPSFLYRPSHLQKLPPASSPFPPSLFVLLFQPERFLLCGLCGTIGRLQGNIGTLKERGVKDTTAPPNKTLPFVDHVHLGFLVFQNFGLSLLQAHTTPVASNNPCW
jgi:hypothetical protein